MSYVIIDPDLMGVAADELQGIGSTLAASNTAAAAPTTGVLAPATDTVSVRAAALLDAHAQQYQALSAQAEAFHDKFVQTLLAAKNAYADIEAENATAMQSSPDKIALIMGGTGDSTPNLKYMTAIDQAYLAQHYPGYTLVSLQTPEQFWPLTGHPVLRSIRPARRRHSERRGRITDRRRPPGPGRGLFAERHDRHD